MVMYRVYKQIHIFLPSWKMNETSALAILTRQASTCFKFSTEAARALHFCPVRRSRGAGKSSSMPTTGAGNLGGRMYSHLSICSIIPRTSSSPSSLSNSDAPGTFRHDCPLQCLQTTVHFNPAFLQLQRQL